MTIFSNGGPPLTADNANQWVQTWDTVADLRGQIGTSTSFGVPQTVYLQGFQSPGDGGQGSFYWNANSNAADDGGVTTVVPSGSMPGAWVRVASPVVTMNVTFTGIVSNTLTVITQATLPTSGMWIGLGYMGIILPPGTNLLDATGGLSAQSSMFTVVGTNPVAVFNNTSASNASFTYPVVAVFPNIQGGAIIYFLGNLIFTGPAPTYTAGMSLVRVGQ